MLHHGTFIKRGIKQEVFIANFGLQEGFKIGAEVRTARLFTALIRIPLLASGDPTG